MKNLKTVLKFELSKQYNGDILVVQCVFFHNSSHCGAEAYSQFLI